MSGIYILKNVYNFAQILNVANSTKHLGKWDESTLQKALKWAQYCEEIYKHVSHQGYAEDINPKIVQMSALLNPPSLLVMNFDCLRNATDLVIESILTNSDGCPGLKKRLETIVNPTIWSKVSKKIKSRPPFNDLDRSFSVLWIQNQSQLQIVQDRNSLTYAQILLKDIVSIIAASENEQTVQKYLLSLFDLLVSFDKGWEILVHFFVINSAILPSELESSRKPLLSSVLSWVNRRLQETTVKCPILELDVAILKQASLNSSGFLNLYLSSLEKWGQDFQPCINGADKELWRDSDNIGVSHLIQYFHHLLLNSDDDISSGESSKQQSLKTQVLASLTTNIKQSDFTVWRTVASTLLGS